MAAMQLLSQYDRYNSEFDIVVMRCTRLREKDRKELCSEGPEIIAIRTPLITRICINSGLNIVKNRHE